MANDSTTPVQAAPSAPPAPSAAVPPAPAQALVTAKQVEELADQLSACADSIHARVMSDIRRHGGGEVPAAEQAAARALFDAETELRQHADRLYAEAAACIVSSLGQSQKNLIQLTVDAAAKIRQITRISDGITLVARLLGLAAAAATGHAAPILLAVDALKLQLDVIALHNPPAAAAQAAASPPSSDS